MTRTHTFTWSDPCLNGFPAGSSGMDYLRALSSGEVEMSPMARLMNVSLLEAEPGHVVVRVEPAEYHYNPIGVVHGGLAATALDYALFYSVFSELPAGITATTMELGVKLMRAITLQTGPLHCEATTIHVGRQLATAEARLMDSDGRIYAHGTTTCLVVPVPDDYTPPSSSYNSERSRTISWEDPVQSAKAILSMKGLDAIRAVADGTIPSPPIAILLGMSNPEEVAEGRAVFTCHPAEFHYNPACVAHGGLAATMLASALGCSVHTTLPAGVGYTTVQLQVNYLRPITMESGLLRAEAQVVHAGKHMATAEARLMDTGGKLYAHGSTVCLVFPIRTEQ